MNIYWNASLGVTCNVEDMESMCLDARGWPVVWPEDMGWEMMTVFVNRKTYVAYINGEFDTAMYESDKVGV